VRVPTSSNFRIVIPQYDPKHIKHPTTSGHYQQRDNYAETTPLKRQESGRYSNEADSADDDTGSETKERSTAVLIIETRRKIKQRVYQKTRKSNRQVGKVPKSSKDPGASGEGTGIFAVQDIESRDID
jgi:hypothetical protein